MTTVDWTQADPTSELFAGARLNGLSAVLAEQAPARRACRQNPADVRVEAARAALAAGRFVLLTSDGGHADLIGAAAVTTDAAMAFLVRHSSGFVCVALPHTRADELNLPAMTTTNQNPRGTSFAVTVDAAVGVSTGISASDRCRTVRLLAAADSVDTDLQRPGHVVPIRAASDGVLERQGHSEAATDLVRLADRGSAAVMAALHLDDAYVLDDAEPHVRDAAARAFAGAHGLACVSVEDVVSYRDRRRPLVTRGGRARLPLPQGTFTGIGYRDDDGREHLALVYGDPGARERTPVVVHRESVLADALGVSTRGPTVEDHLLRLAEQGCGVLVYLRSAGTGPTGMVADFRRMSASELGAVPLVPGDPEPRRTALMSAQILADLRLTSIELHHAPAALGRDLDDLGFDVTSVGHTTAWVAPAPGR